MINNNNKSQLFQCKCFYKSVNKKKNICPWGVQIYLICFKNKGGERTENMPGHAVYHQQEGVKAETPSWKNHPGGRVWEALVGGLLCTESSPGPGQLQGRGARGATAFQVGEREDAMATRRGGRGASWLLSGRKLGRTHPLPSLQHVRRTDDVDPKWNKLKKEATFHHPVHCTSPPSGSLVTVSAIKSTPDQTSAPRTSLLPIPPYFHLHTQDSSLRIFQTSILHICYDSSCSTFLRRPKPCPLPECPSHPWLRSLPRRAFGHCFFSRVVMVTSCLAALAMS